MYNILIYASLTLAWIGDMFFLVKHRGDHHFVLGLIAFIFAHLCKIMVFVLDCLHKAKQELEFFPLLMINFIHFGTCTLTLGKMFPYMGDIGNILFL